MISESLSPSFTTSQENEKVKYSVWSVLAIVSLMTVIQFILFDATYVHFYPGYFNDQIGYIGSARHFADFGRFIFPGHFEGTGTAIIPTLLKSGNTRLYIPGPMLLQAFFIKLFGASGIAVKLHNILCYIASTALVFLIGRKIYDEKTGFWSAMIFLILPFNVLYAMTALIELPIIFSALFSFYIFISIPNRWRIFSLAPLVLFTYFFRQTTLFMMIPMLAYWYDHRSNQPLWYAPAFALITFFTCFIASTIDVHMGRASLTFFDNLIHGHMNYADAFPADHESISFSKLANILISHFYKQLKYVFHGLTRPRWNYKLVNIYTGYVMIFFTTLTVIGGWRSKKEQLFPLGSALMMFAMLGVCLTLYSGILHILVKTTFYCTAFLIIPAVAFIFNPNIFSQNRFLRFIHNRRQFIFIFMAALSMGMLGLTAYKTQVAKHIQEDNNQFVESVNPVPNMTVSSTPYLFTLYNIKHYPQLTTFIPANKKTLELVNKKYPIGTMIIPDNDINQKLSREDIESIGLTFRGKRLHQGKVYWIFKRPMASVEKVITGSQAAPKTVVPVIRISLRGTSRLRFKRPGSRKVILNSTTCDHLMDLLDPGLSKHPLLVPRRVFLTTETTWSFSMSSWRNK